MMDLDGDISFSDPGDGDSLARAPLGRPRKTEPAEYVKWSKESDTYGEWMRRVARNQLNRGERATLDEERRWDAAHPTEVAALDALVGRTVKLVKTMKTLREDIECAASKRDVPATYPKGMRLRVRARLGANLLVYTGDGCALSVRPDWVERDG